MATIQARVSRGRKYWYLVESRRVDGKPRPIVLEYLGRPEDLLKRLRGLTDTFQVKSYSHGAVAALLDIAAKLDVVPIINQYIKSPRSYMAEKPIRHHLTAGMTLLLAAIGRACMPTSKRGWWNWAKTTSVEYLLRVSLGKVDSQHFWDLMDALPEEAIERIELDLLRNVLELYDLDPHTLLYDTTNFYTFIHTTNTRCRIAQRGKNKQKRHDLRQVGLALVVTRQDYVPLFHHTYQGNVHDSVIFSQVIRRIKARMIDLDIDLKKHTLVFDRGCNSKKNMRTVKRLRLSYVGALTPSHHLDLIEAAEGNFIPISVKDTELLVHREKRVIWGEERTALVLISERLKAGQLRGIYQTLKKKKAELRSLQRSLANPRAQKRTREELEQKIDKLIKGPFLEGLLSYSLDETDEGRFVLRYRTSREKLDELEDKLGFRILMTDRHEWSTAEIIEAFYGQSSVELAFKNIKNPYHLAVTPEFHWTDQKIRVHYFTCVLGYLLSSLLWREARRKTRFNGTLDHFLDTLSNIRLAALLEEKEGPGRLKATYRLEKMDEEEQMLMDALGLLEFHVLRHNIKGVGVYD